MKEHNTTAALVPAKPEAAAMLPASEFSAFGNIVHFENAQRMAKALSSSTMVPDRYRGEQNLGSCMIALEISNRIGMNVLAVMQNLYDVHGKPAWSSQFLIACVNACRKFSPIRYQMTGQKGTDSYGCIAWATDRTGERLESPEITIGIAKSEGWYQKNGSKWKTMPELMLRYRTATLFARLYAPELTMGIHTEDEVVDVVEVSPPAVAEPVAKKPKFVAASKPQEKIVEVVPEPEQKDEPVNQTPLTPEAAPDPAPEPQSTPAQFPRIQECEAAGITPDQALAFYNSNAPKENAAENLDGIPEASFKKMISTPVILEKVKKVKVG